MIHTTAPEAAGTEPEPRQHRRFGFHNLRTGWSRWRHSRPFWGGLFAILGGVFMMYGPLTAYKFVFVASSTVGLGLVVGLLVAVFGLFLWFAPSQRQITGVLIVVLSLLSFVTSDLGGFVIGMILGIVGGSLGFGWVPTAPKVKRYRARRLLHIPAPRQSPATAAGAPAGLAAGSADATPASG